jgi:hypothetical protein
VPVLHLWGSCLHTPPTGVMFSQVPQQPSSSSGVRPSPSAESKALTPVIPPSTQTTMTGIMFQSVPTTTPAQRTTTRAAIPEQGPNPWRRMVDADARARATFAVRRPKPPPPIEAGGNYTFGSFGGNALTESPSPQSPPPTTAITLPKPTSRAKAKAAAKSAKQTCRACIAGCRCSSAAKQIVSLGCVTVANAGPG